MPHIGEFLTPPVLKSSGAAGVGYSTGAGGTVTQATSKATDVTVNKLSGKITTHDASLVAGSIVRFLVNNSLVEDTDVVVAHRSIGGTGGAYNIWCDNVVTGGGGFRLNIKNETAGALAEAIDINFVVIKGSTA